MLQTQGHTVDYEPIFTDIVNTKNRIYNITLIAGKYKQLTIELKGSKVYYLDCILPLLDNKKTEIFYKNIIKEIDIIL